MGNNTPSEVVYFPTMDDLRRAIIGADVTEMFLISELIRAGQNGTLDSEPVRSLLLEYNKRLATKAEAPQTQVES